MGQNNPETKSNLPHLNIQHSLMDCRLQLSMGFSAVNESKTRSGLWMLHISRITKYVRLWCASNLSRNYLGNAIRDILLPTFQIEKSCLKKARCLPDYSPRESPQKSPIVNSGELLQCCLMTTLQFPHSGWPWPLYRDKSETKRPIKNDGQSWVCNIQSTVSRCCYSHFVDGKTEFGFAFPYSYVAFFLLTVLFPIELGISMTPLF